MMLFPEYNKQLKDWKLYLYMNELFVFKQAN